MTPFTLSDNVKSEVPTMPYRRRPEDPVHRSLRVYTQDAGTSRYDVPVTVARVPWEPVDPGPNGSVFVVYDRNDTRQETYAPIDLDSDEVLRGQGLPPSTADPRFAQQMAYALAMSVFQRFTLALGRVPDLAVPPQAQSGRRVLTVRPHAAEDDNAYYDAETASLDFGYVFATSDAGGRLQKGAVVFTSLSHDIVIHETTHAVLDGMRPLFMMPSNPDVAAFHEGFADLVALLLRFQYRELVERAMEDSGPTLGGPLLTEVARQWGRSSGTGREALRRVVLESGDPEDRVDKKHQYDPKKEEHDLGAVLVAAVFEAMNRVFVKKTRHVQALADVAHAPRAASVSLLAREAQKLAADFLNILIRSVDYCPPMDITYGDFLRAVITADAITVPEDPSGYREALVHAFRRYGIHVPGVADLSEESLLWRPPERPLPRILGLAFSDLRHVYEPGWPVMAEERKRRANALGVFVTEGRHAYFGLAQPGERDGMVIEPPVIQSIRSLRRLTPDRELDFHIVAEITQRRRTGRGRWFYGGSTVVIDETGLVRYVIGKNVLNTKRAAATELFLSKAPASYRAAAAGRPGANRAMLRQWHRAR